MTTIRAQYGSRPTDLELDVLELVATGHTNRVIAEQLWIAEDSVKSRLRRLAGRLGARDRSHAVTLAVAAGYLAVDADSRVLRSNNHGPRAGDDTAEPDRWHVEDEACVPAWDLAVTNVTEAVAWTDGVQLDEDFQDAGPQVDEVEATARKLLAAVAWHRHLAAQPPTTANRDQINARKRAVRESKRSS